MRTSTTYNISKILIEANSVLEIFMVHANEYFQSELIILCLGSDCIEVIGEDKKAVASVLERGVHTKIQFHDIHH